MSFRSCMRDGSLAGRANSPKLRRRNVLQIHTIDAYQPDEAGIPRAFLRMNITMEEEDLRRLEQFAGEG